MSMGCGHVVIDHTGSRDRWLYWRKSSWRPDNRPMSSGKHFKRLFERFKLIYKKINVTDCCEKIIELV